MAEKYNEVMNRIELSSEARSRILGGIQAVERKTPKRSRVIRFPQWRRFTAMAACAAVVLLAAVTLHNPRESAIPDGPAGSVTVANGIVECANAKELADALGFAVAEPAELPFAVTETSFAAWWGEMAQIVYTGAEQSVTLRKQAGDADISGDYNHYTDVNTVSVNGCDVTFKGNGGTVSTTVWTNGGYSFSVLSDPPLSADAMTALIAQII